MKILFATSNKHKVSEIKNKIEPLGFSIITPYDLGIEDAVEETGTTFQENAQIKADYYHNLTGLDTIADDSGLNVNQLKGAPGVYSSRYAGENASDADNMKKLLSDLKGIQDRSAKFISLIAYRTKQGIHFFQGDCPGEILKQKQGNQGFGYDPIFYLPQLKKSMAEINIEKKNSISHRAKALAKFIKYLESHNENK